MASIEVSEKAGVRYLHFGSSWIQGAMRVARPWALELEYTRDMMLPLALHSRRDWPRHALVIGLGAGSIPKFLYRHYPRTHVHVVEIERGVVAAARQFFRLPADDPPRLAIEIVDGDDYVARARREFDLIVVDGFDAHGRAGALDTLPFYCRARALLSPRGIMSVNLLGRSRGFRQSLERLREVFDGRSVALPRSAFGNVIAFGSAGDAIEVTFAELRSAAAKLRRNTGLNLLPTIARMTASGIGDPLVL